MNWIQHITSAFSQMFKIWFVVQPWEQSLRVRMGKSVVQFGAGVHFKIPFFDKVYIQNTRDRFSCTTVQTVTTTDGKAITFCGNLRYRLGSILKLYTTLHQPEDTILQEVESSLAEFIISHELIECSALALCQHVRDTINLEAYGLEDVRFFLTDFMVVKTYRLITGEMYKYAKNPSRLDTNMESGGNVDRINS